MKVLIIIDHWFPNIGGGPRHVFEIARRLKKMYPIDVEIVTSKLLTKNADWKKFSNIVSNLKIVYLPPQGEFENFSRRIQFLVHLFRYLMTHDFDILHIHPFTPLLIAKLISIIKNKPVVMTVHVSGRDLTGNGIIDSIFCVLDRFLTFGLTYDAQIFVDESLLKIDSRTKNKIYIPNGVDTLVFDQVTPKKRKPFHFIFVGRLHPQKNLFNLVQAYALFNNKIGQRTKLVIVGDGPEKKSLKLLVKRLHINSSIYLAGSVTGKKLIRSYKESQVFILPSYYEGFPLTVLEAWAAKIPVAVSNVGQLKKIVTDGVNGYITDDVDKYSLAGFLERIYRSKNKKMLGKKGYKMVKNYYQWDDISAKTYKLYKSIVKKRSHE